MTLTLLINPQWNWFLWETTVEQIIWGISEYGIVILSANYSSKPPSPVPKTIPMLAVPTLSLR